MRFDRLLRIAGRYADAWHGLGDPVEFTRKTRILDTSAEAAGRDPASIPPRGLSLHLRTMG